MMDELACQYAFYGQPTHVEGVYDGWFGVHCRLMRCRLHKIRVIFSCFRRAEREELKNPLVVSILRLVN